MSEKKLLWARLKNMRCPKDNGALTRNEETGEFYCLQAKCDFKMSSQRFDEVVKSLYSKGMQVNSHREDNLTALNNL